MYFLIFIFQNGENVTSYCDRTFSGWSRDVTVRNWACFKGVKVDEVEPKIHIRVLQKVSGIIIPKAFAQTHFIRGCGLSTFYKSTLSLLTKRLTVLMPQWDRQPGILKKKRLNQSVDPTLVGAGADPRIAKASIG